MNRFFLRATLLLAFSFAVMAVALPPTVDGKSDNLNSSVSGVAIGETVNDFTLPDVEGQKHSLSSLRGKNGTALIFVSVQCPVSNAYNARMAQLAADYKAKGINVIGINSNLSLIHI